MSSKDDRNSAMHENCKERLKKCLDNNLYARKLMNSINELGCQIPEKFFTCIPCSSNKMSGGFLTYDGSNDYKPKIIVCEDVNLPLKDIFESIVVHELIHAYDFCRSKIDVNNCVQHACSEIRASAMSGECNYLPEILRGNTALVGGLSSCVKRRAELSVSANPACKDIAKLAVDQAYVKCIEDRKPFIND